MFFKRNQGYMPFNDYKMSSPPNGSQNDIEHLMIEIKENRRRIQNLAKRIVRLENYLRIRDSSDYSIIDDE